MRVYTVLFLAVLLSACVHGYSAENEGVPAGTPFGRHIELAASRVPGTQAGDTVSGELLYVESQALVVLTDSAIVRVPLANVQHYNVFPVERRDRPERDIPTTTEPFRTATRYPEPLTRDRLRELIEELGVEWIDLGTPADPPGGAGPPAVSSGSAAARGPAQEEGLERALAEARSAADRLASLEAAIAEGYRRLGPDFPGMGEHWIHPGRIVAGRIDPARPPVICYVRIHGEPRLVSLAYTLPLGPDELPPAEPFGRNVWHDHSETVDEESLLLAHPGSHHGAEGTRLAMVHLWVWPENPDGILAQNNWRLPFAVAGLPFAGIDPGVDAGRGLSLHTAGSGYYEALFTAAADPSPRELMLLRTVLAEYQDRAAAWAARVGDRDTVSSDDLDAIAGVWASLWDEVHKTVDSSTWDRLAPLR